MTHFLVVGARSAGAVLASEASPDYPSVRELPDDLRDSRGLGVAVHHPDYGLELEAPKPAEPEPKRAPRLCGQLWMILGDPQMLSSS